MSTKALKQQLIAAIAMVLVAAIALGSSTYAWFVNNATVTATGAQVTSSTAYSLLIADALNGESTDWQTTKALAPNSGLTPVSTIGTTAASALVGKTVAGTGVPSAAADIGDIRFVASNEWQNNLVINYDEVTKKSYTSYSNPNGVPYYYTDTIYLKAGQASSVYLDSNTTGLKWNGVFTTFDNFMLGKAADGNTALAAFSDGGSTQTESNCSLKKAQALVKTLRVGLQVTKVTGKIASTEDGDRNNLRKNGNFFVYQLDGTNIDTEVITTKQNSADGVSSAIGPTSSDDSAITASTGVANLANDANTKITAFKSLVSNRVPVIKNMMVAGDSMGIVGDVEKADGTSKSIATVDANDVVEVDIYIWMEGCDGDVAAVNLNEFNSAMIPGIQFGFCLGNDATTT